MTSLGEELVASDVDSIKVEVANLLRTADPDMDVKKTAYFNHTYAPDLILTWPQERKLTRRVFLRTTSNPSYLAQDIELTDDSSSILMPLSPVAGDEDASQELQESARDAKVLVAEESGIADLAERRTERHVVELASRAILQGGAGLVDANRASDFALGIAEGFDAAQEGRSDETKSAIALASNLLDGPRRGRIESFLHAVWIGSGAEDDQFPGPSGLGARLDAGSLSLLLETIDLDDTTFWQRVARNLTLPLLASLQIDPACRIFSVLRMQRRPVCGRVACALSQA